MDQLESIQYQAGLIATGCWKNTNRNKLYCELGWDSLSNRRHNRRLYNYHKIVQGESPEYLKKYVPLSPLPATASQRLKRSFFPYCFEKYNSLDPSLKTLNAHCFKNSLTKITKPKKKLIPNTPDLKGIKHLTCLRVGHSDLREHRFSKSFNCPSPLCKCGLENESTEHFLLRCPTFNSSRGILIPKVLKLLEINNIAPPDDDEKLSKILLYGYESLLENKNKRILSHTIHYIKCTKRFDTLEAFNE